MGKNRYAAKVDKNQGEIVIELIQAGFSVKIGHDDILVGYCGLTFWYEVKSDVSKSKKSGKVLESRIKDSQKKLREEWRGHYKIVSSSEEIITDIGQTIKRMGNGI